jgi:hypothetical protein
MDVATKFWGGSGCYNCFVLYSQAGFGRGRSETLIGNETGVLFASEAHFNWFLLPPTLAPGRLLVKAFLDHPPLRDGQGHENPVIVSTGAR